MFGWEPEKSALVLILSINEVQEKKLTFEVLSSRGSEVKERLLKVEETGLLFSLSRQSRKKFQIILYLATWEKFEGSKSPLSRSFFSKFLNFSRFEKPIFNCMFSHYIMNINHNCF